MSSLMTSPALMVMAGTGSVRFSPSATAPALEASQIKPAARAPPNHRAAVMTRPRSAHVLGDRLRHLVGRGDHLGIHLVGALRLDQLGDLLDGIDVRGFEIGLHDLAEAQIAGDADDRGTR